VREDYTGRQEVTMSEHEFAVTMEQISGLEFKVRFDWESADELVMDEPEPIGQCKGPNATRLLAAAIGNCLTASLAFCLQRARSEVTGLRTTVNCMLERNEKKRLRVKVVRARIQLPEGVKAKPLERCLGLFEDFCIVSGSVRKGLQIDVEVVDSEGNQVAIPE